jgi:hypothetical protein
VLPSRIAAVLASLPDFALAAVACITWVSPATLGEEKVAWFLGLMLLEFIVVHSAAFLGAIALSDAPRSRRLVQALGLSAFYTLFAAGFALGMKHWWPLAAFWGLTVNRLLGIALGQAPRGKERELMQAGWAAGAMAYLFGAFVTVLAPLPAFGVRPEMLGAAGEDSSGLWIDEPHRVVAFAMVYFTLAGLFTLFAHRWTTGDSASVAA